ncbi:TonB-dependent receptor plug domain-containing protein [Rhizorhapis sp. SPR117]|uniref:TonB-dependent receptor plug domain-containing protein n=1 Tax=Rhizorhapis sp. SPR117 TaxID=2912611 RepID=UPI001F28195F|nr:TonB-dependent receptor plug domain-containing protein [Rhizorhapis sp. SPR117]
MNNSPLFSCVHRLCTVSTFALIAQFGAPAIAQTEPQPGAVVPGSADIIVTARRREENLQDVPVSIVAFSQEGIRQNNVASAADLGRVAPGLVAYTGNSVSSTQNSFAIRGRGLLFGAAAGSVETYFAEVPLSANYSSPELPAQFFDLASVQVLKGPQGTLFGRSTTGGAVLVQPAAPTNDWEGYGRVQLGNYNNVQVEGALNIPVIDDVLAIRLAGQHWKRDGYVTNESTLPADVQARLATDPAYVQRLAGFGTTFANGQVRDLLGRLVIDNGTIIESTTGRPIERTAYNNKQTTDC